MKKISVKNLVRGDLGTSESFDIKEELESPNLPDGVTASEVVGKLKLIRLDDTILANGNFKTTISTPCDRCLENFEQGVNFTLEREYEIDRLVKSEGHLQVDKYLDIDITVPVNEELILAIPMQNICSDECQGLCQSCGSNKNKEQCNCK